MYLVQIKTQYMEICLEQGSRRHLCNDRPRRCRDRADLPILPRLIDSVTHAGNVAHYIGIMTALYAAMQFIFAPMLGALSDRLGRRPVLLISMTGAAINYLIMAFAPQLWMLLIGRAIAGLTSANISVATAYLTDISAEKDRARRFGLLNATFGIGFIVGPILGRIFGDYGLRLPFIAAAVLNAGNLLLALFVPPSSRAGQAARNASRSTSRHSIRSARSAGYSQCRA